MVKAAWFQLHWFLGITAGIVLAIVGVTGGMLSFEDDILDALNPGIRTVAAQPGGPLAPDALLERIRAAAPGRTITALTVSADPEKTARVTLAPLPGGPGGPRGEVRYVNPYDGALLGEPQGLEFFRTTMRIHRWLAADEIGKQIVGASTIALIILSASGLYLRWPRRFADLRAWFALDLRRKGRNLFWELHSVIGTWVLPFYLLASFTGLYWSYDWYRSALFDLTGTPRPQQARQAAPPGAPPAGQVGPQRGEGAGRRPDGPAAPRAPLDLARLWPIFIAQSGGYSSATLRLPQGNAQTLTISYQTPNPAHERANNTLVLDATGTVREHRRYDDLPAGQKLMGSIFVLHSGSFFGLPGLILMMVASLLMPLFAITGWLLYLDRRAKKSKVRAAARSAQAIARPAASAGTAPLLLAYASQSGTAEALALQSAAALQGAGVSVNLLPLARLTQADFDSARRALFVVSTFGEGEPPDSARGFARAAARGQFSASGVGYGLLALGDRAYPRFCGFGHALDGWLRTAGARPLFAPIEVDGTDAQALGRWQAELGRLADAEVTLPTAAHPAFLPWRLVFRRCLNPQSAGLPTFHLGLAPPAGVAADWQAGDVIEIRPRNGADEVAAWLARTGQDGAAPVSWDGQVRPLSEVLARAHLPDDPAPTDPQALADSLAPLAHRDYSIASLPADGRLDLLVRQSRTADGRMGLGSGFLTSVLPEGGEVEARIRSNPAFAPPPDNRPLLLIGNGTGLAGLRAHIKAREAKGHDRNWLIFGERNRARDFYFADEIAAWQGTGLLKRVDLAFSRDQNSRVYVQDCLRGAGSQVRAWIAEGGAVYVCGSLAGMAPAVDGVLTDLVGADMLERMIAERRYCRDVY